MSDMVESNAYIDPVDRRTPLIIGGEDFHSITELVARPVEEGVPRAWWVVFTTALALFTDAFDNNPFPSTNAFSIAALPAQKF